MAPETRSRGVPAPSRVYHSTPSLQQAHFPARRRLARTYGRRDRKAEPSEDTGKASGRAVRNRRLRQQTLTQIDFVSSFEEEEDDPITLSDSEREEFDMENKENHRPPDDKTEDGLIPTAGSETDNDTHEDNDEPAPSSERKRQRRTTSKPASKHERSKRRRTQGDSTTVSRLTNQERKARRRTAGDVPTSSYHTQTLTQFMGGLDHDYHRLESVADSADEDDDFDDWLQTEPGSPSPRGTSRGRTHRPPRAARQVLSQDDEGDDDASTVAHAPGRVDKEAEGSRQTSVVPQTPAKRTPRTEIPSSSQQTTPFNSTMLDRYGPPDKPHESPTARRFQPATETQQLVDLPGKPKAVSVSRGRAMLVVQDSFATTDSWGTAGDASNVTPLRSQSGFNSQASSPRSPSPDDTPTKSRQRTENESCKTETTMLERSAKPSKEATPPVMEQVPHQPSRNLALEIPDSEDEEDDFTDDEQAEENQKVQSGEQIEDPQDKHVEDQPNQKHQECDEGATFDAGPETQLLLGEVASSVSQNSKHVSNGEIPQDLALGPTRAKRRQTPKPVNHVSASQPSSPQLPRHPSPHRSLTDTKPLRRPISRSLIRSSQPTQPLESQRVPLATIQGLGAPAFGTDLLLPVSPATLRPLVSGHQIHLSLPFSVPGSAVRLWLFDGAWLQYMACADSHSTKGAAGAWQYGISQVFELNNPLEEQDMRDEGWLEGDIGRYRNIPPAVAAQLLANLRHALFRDDDETTLGDDEDGEYTEREAEQGQPQPPLQSPRRRAGDAASKGKPSSTTAGSSFSISQQVEAQLRSDIANSTTNGPLSDDVLVPSTPGAHRTTVSCSTPTPASAAAAATTNADISSDKITLPPPLLPPPRHSKPSQTTIASQVSNPEIAQPQQQQQHQRLSSSARCSPPHTQSSSSHLTFQDYGSSPAFARGYNQSNTSSIRLPSSQLLTKSQMLPDSLIRDDCRMPSQTWDSDDDW
jgi:hypothetical protein